MLSLIYRCNDRHLFTADWGRLVVASVHFGRAKYLRCPVDRHWQMARPVSRTSLTEEQLVQAAQYKF